MSDDVENPKVDDGLASALAELNAQMSPRLIRAFHTWVEIREIAEKDMKRVREKLAGRVAQFKEAMEVGHRTPEDQCLKLTVIEDYWQELEEARAELKDLAGVYKDQIKAAEQKIRDLIAEAKSNQLSLFGGSGAADDQENQQS